MATAETDEWQDLLSLNLDLHGDPSMVIINPVAKCAIIFWSIKPPTKLFCCNRKSGLTFFLAVKA